MLVRHFVQSGHELAVSRAHFRLRHFGNFVVFIFKMCDTNFARLGLCFARAVFETVVAAAVVVWHRRPGRVSGPLCSTES
ncbi:MAG: hypothetical protein VB876_07290, partial [Pirellulales bacterium]